METCIEGSYLSVWYDGWYWVEVHISSNYGDQIEGMLGNANGNDMDDFTTRQGLYVGNHWNRNNLVGQSWTVTNRRKRRYAQFKAISNPLI